MKRKVLIFVLLIVTFSVHFCFSEERIARIFASENGLARYVDIDGRIGLVNDSGEVLVNAIYDDISMFDENGLAITTRTIDGETFCGLINKDGVQIVDDSAFCYIDVGYHSALGNSARYGVYEARTQNGKLCFLFADGTVGMYPDFSALGNTTREDAMNINSFFVNGSVFLRSVKGWCLYGLDACSRSDEFWDAYEPFPIGGGAVQKDGLWGMISANGQLLKNYQYTQRPQYTDFGIVVGNAESEEKPFYGIISLDGSELLPMQFEDIFPAGEDLLAVKTEDVYGYMDSTFQWIISPRWDEVESFSNHLACVMKDQELYVIDDHGKELLNIPDPSGKWILLTEQIGVYDEETNTLTLLNRDGKTVHFFEQIWIDPEGELSDAMMPVAIGDESNLNYGYLNLETGNIITNPDWCETGSFKDGRAVIVTSEALYGVIDLDGNTVIEPVYPYISRVEYANDVYFEVDMEEEGTFSFVVFNRDGSIIEYINRLIPTNG